MRIDSVNSAQYTTVQTVRLQPADRPESVANTQPPEKLQPEKVQSQKEQQNLGQRMKEQLKRDWKVLGEWMKKLLQQGREMLSKVAQMLAKLGNFWAQPAEKPAENGIVPPTWQENFKQRVKMFFDAVAGFFSRHLPMNNGSFSGTKKEDGQEDFTGKSEKREESKEQPNSHIDIRG